MTSPAVNVDGYIQGSAALTRKKVNPPYTPSDTGYYANFGQPSWKIRRRIVKPATVNTKPWQPYAARPITNWSRSSLYLAIPSAQYYFKNPSTNEESWYCYTPNTSVSGVDMSFDAGALGRATTGLLNSFKSEGEAYLGLALLERKQTEKLLTTTVRRIVDGVLAFKKADPRRWKQFMRVVRPRNVSADEAKRRGLLPLDAAVRDAYRRRETTLKAIPQAWLELQYGWKPIMGDVYAAMSAVDFHQRNNLYTFTKVERAGTNIGNTAVVSGSTVLFRTPVVIKKRCEISTTYRLNTSVLGPLANLGLLNPLNLLWEKLPFSFVVDWFLPLGNWFNTFDATLGKTFVTGYRTEKSKVDPTPLVPVAKAEGVAAFVRMEGQNGYTQTEFRRTKLLSFPSPIYPALKNPCSPTHVANALSLLAVAMGSGVGRLGLRL